MDLMLRLLRRRMDDQWGKSTVSFLLMGHSMGGQLVLTVLTRPPGANIPAVFSPATMQGLAGVVGCAPWLDLVHAPPKPLVALAPWLMRTFPTFPWRHPQTRD